MINTSSPQWVPSKKIFSSSDLGNFKRSIAYHDIRRTLAFIIEKVKGQDVPPGILNVNIVTRCKPKKDVKPEFDSIETGIEPTETYEASHTKLENMEGIIHILAELASYIDKYPPLPGARRFGNLACRDWHKEVLSNIKDLLRSNIRPSSRLDFDAFIDESSYYLASSFGSSIRLDYGTGHELSFLAFIGGCFDCKILDVDRVSGTDLLIIFAKYYDLVRRLILEYSLEPAGSHGVWGLDDHFHLIYIIGAAQFNDNKKAPSVQHVLTTQTISILKTSNFYVNAVAFIFKIKTGPFNEHSPIIYDIHSTVSLWSKVLSGLLKMYDVEVLNKFPVVQHFCFGKLLYPWKEVNTKSDLPVFDSGIGETEMTSNYPPSATRNASTITGASWRQQNIRNSTLRSTHPKSQKPATENTESIQKNCHTTENDGG